MISLADQSQPRGYPSLSFVSEKVTKIERCTSVSVQLSEGLGWAFHHGEGGCQGVAMCPSPSKRITINLALQSDATRCNGVPMGLVDLTQEIRGRRRFFRISKAQNTRKSASCGLNSVGDPTDRKS